MTEDDPFYIDEAKNFPPEETGFAMTEPKPKAVASAEPDEPLVEAQLVEDPELELVVVDDDADPATIERAGTLNHFLGEEIAQLAVLAAEAVGKRRQRLLSRIAVTTGAILMALGVAAGPKSAEAGEKRRVITGMGAEAAWQGQAEMEQSKYNDINDAAILEMQVLPGLERQLEDATGALEQLNLELRQADLRIEAAQEAGQLDEADRLIDGRKPMVELSGKYSDNISRLETEISNARKRVKELRSTGRKVKKSLGAAALRAAAGALGRMGY